MAKPEKMEKRVFLLAALICHFSLCRVAAVCEFGIHRRNSLYNFRLTTPIRNYPHGALSEDGFYKVAVNGTLLWFQICDQMIFNHDAPRCFGCQDCGGSLRCGMECSALVARNIGGYYVCTSIGQASNSNISLIDEKNPQEGVIVKMSAIGSTTKCSLSVSVFCNVNGVQGPNSLDKLGTCDYATVLRHPSGCPTIISVHGRGWGWFVTLITIFLCLFGAYLLAGAVYRYFFLGIRGKEVVPNLDFWSSLPQRAQGLFGSLVRRFRRHPQGSQSSYSPVNF